VDEDDFENDLKQNYGTCKGKLDKSLLSAPPLFWAFVFSLYILVKVWYACTSITSCDV